MLQSTLSNPSLPPVVFQLPCMPPFHMTPPHLLPPPPLLSPNTPHHPSSHVLWSSLFYRRARFGPLLSATIHQKWRGRGGGGGEVGGDPKRGGGFEWVGWWLYEFDWWWIRGGELVMILGMVVWVTIVTVN